MDEYELTSPAEAVLSTPELYALIAERVFDPERGFTAEQLDVDDRPPAWHDLATLASLACVNRALSRMPWPTAAGAAHVALGHEAEAARRRRAPDIQHGHTPEAVAARAAVKATLEAGLAAVAHACVALDTELLGDDDDGSNAGAPTATLAREPGSAVERMYRACLVYAAVDALWRDEPESRDAPLLLPEPPPQLARALCAHGLSARLPAEVSAAALATLGAVLLRLAHLANAVGARSTAVQPQPEPSAREQLGELARAELDAACRALEGAVYSAAWCRDNPLALGPLGLVLEGMQADLGCLFVVVRDLCPWLCRLFADQGAPIGVRTCAAAALERYAHNLIVQLEDGVEDWVFAAADLFAKSFDTSGAAALYRALSADVDRTHSSGKTRRGRRGRGQPPPLVIPVSRALLLSVARKMVCSVDRVIDIVEDVRPRIPSFFLDFQTHSTFLELTSLAPAPTGPE